MSESLASTINKICGGVGKDQSRLMDIVEAVQAKNGYISSEAIDLIAKELGIPRVEVASLVSFYAFFSDTPKGKIVIRLCNDIIDKYQGVDQVAEAFKQELGIDFGETTKDGKISLEWAPCIGMSDQAPAALVNDVVVTYLSSDKAREIVRTLKETGDPKRLVKRLGDGFNAHELVRSMVHNNLRRKGQVLFADFPSGEGLRKALAMSSVEVIREIKTARLRGRGGAGFPTGLKWEFTRNSDGKQKYVLCNADEGEPGTFKDRVLLTERADMLFEGMTIAGYAIGAEMGILYLRGEYAYLEAYLNKVLDDRRRQGWLGANIMGKQGFNFDIRIQMGAGAYVCGEETALISSCEGLRGDPKNRPPFPAQKGYLGNPSTVNNVETFCCVPRIIEQGAAWFSEIGSHGSPGTKLLSVSGDCSSPGVYEIPFGMTLADLLKEVGGTDAIAVQMGGPSGNLVGPADFGRTICFDDLATGGSVMIFGPERDVLEVAESFMEFFIHESCGYCTPCRVGNRLLRERLHQIRALQGTPQDIEYLQKLGEIVKAASRCGLGQTSPNPVLTTLKNFRPAYNALVHPMKDGQQPTFDLAQALKLAEKVQGRKAVHHHE
ncbi:MAG: NADH:ubiquinone oxidoreductase [Myxococcales bacterium]|nr:NADH:ubiquinone oxidoreductase [Myxococcales bacterium]